MRTVLILFLLLVSCASSLNQRPKYDPTARWIKERELYRYSPCEERKTLVAYVRMSMPSGCAECSLYFLRCKYLLDIGKPDAQGIQRRIRPRLKEGFWLLQEL